MTPQSENELEVALGRLDALSKKHVRTGREMTAAFGGSLYGLDLLAYGALNRSMAHIRGFSGLIRDRNILCAGALLRLQLDTALRFSAAWLVENPHDFAASVLDGRRVQDMTDQSGKKMTDRYLTERIGEEYPWVPRVYERTSGYVHFSSVHMLAAVSMKPDEESSGFLQLKISEVDAELPDSLYIEAVEAFIAITEVLLKYVVGWTFTKANPKMVARLRDERTN